MELKAVYHIQHRLSINSNVAGVSVAGDGWYADGSIATFSVPVTQLSTGGVLDLLGAKVTFQGWFEGGNLITTSSSGTIEMNSSHTITAQWATDYTMPILFFAAVVIVIGLGVHFVGKRPSRKTKRSTTRKVKRSRGRSKKR
jgi:hypothetical protein